MHPRWNLLMAAALLLGSAGAAAADGDANLTTGAQAEAEADLWLAKVKASVGANASADADVDLAKTQPSTDFTLKVAPPTQRAAPGDAATFEIVAKSRAEQTLHLAVRADADGYSYALSAERIEAGGDARGHAKLVVKVPHEARGSASFLVVAENGHGDREEARALLLVLPKVEEPRPVHREPFALAVEPDVQRISPGGTATFHVVAKSRAAQVLSLEVRGGAEGYEAWLDRDRIEVGPDGRAHATLHVKVGDEPAHRAAKFVVLATSEEGERREATAIVKTTPADEPRPAKPVLPLPHERPLPVDKPGRDDPPAPRPSPAPCEVRLVLRFDEGRFRILLADAEGRLVEGDLGLAMLVAMNGCGISEGPRRMP